MSSVTVKRQIGTYIHVAAILKSGPICIKVPKDCFRYKNVFILKILKTIIQRGKLQIHYFGSLIWIMCFLNLGSVFFKLLPKYFNPYADIRKRQSIQRKSRFLVYDENLWFFFGREGVGLDRLQICKVNTNNKQSQILSIKNWKKLNFGNENFNH